MKIKTKTKNIILCLIIIVIMLSVLRLKSYGIRKINNFWLAPAQHKSKWDYITDIIKFNPIHTTVGNIDTLTIDNGGDTVLLLIYGRAKSMRVSSPLCSAFHPLPATIVLFEFNGVFDSKKTLETMISDSQTICNWIKKKYPNKKIVATGHSFGAHIAIYLDVDAYCLIGGVYSLSGLACGIPVPVNKYDIMLALDTKTFKRGTKLLVMHGTLDPFVSYKESNKIVEHANKVGLDAKIVSMRVGHSFWQTDPVPIYNAMFDFITSL